MAIPYCDVFDDYMATIPKPKVAESKIAISVEKPTIEQPKASGLVLAAPTKPKAKKIMIKRALADA